MTYLDRNNHYWERGYKGYPNENVESFIFRPYGRILAEKFISDSPLAKHKKLLDFGCGAGQPALFFKSNGFEVYGVDISKKNIEICRQRFGEFGCNFKVISPKPNIEQIFFGGQFGLVTAIQSLYYLSNTDLDLALRCLHSQMVAGGLIYCTMIGTNSWCYENSTEFKDGLRVFSAQTRGGIIDEHYVNFTTSNDDLMKKFKIFEPVHIGFHSEKYRNDEGIDFHYTFVGRKK